MLKLIKALMATIVLKLFMVVLGAILVAVLRTFELLNRNGSLSRKSPN